MATMGANDPTIELKLHAIDTIRSDCNFMKSEIN